MWAKRNVLMSRSAASMASECPTRFRPAAATASGLSTFEFGDPPPALGDRVLDEAGDDAPRQFVNDARLFEPGMKVVDLVEQSFDKRDGCVHFVEREETGAQAVVDVVGVVGDVVGDRRRLRLEARMQAQIQTLQLIISDDRGRNAARPVSLGGRARGVKKRPVVLYEARQRRLRQIEPVKGGIAALEFGDDAQAMAVVVEAPVLGHAGVEGVFAGMSEGRVAKVVAKRDRFGEVVVEFQRPGQRARDLRHLDRVGQAGAKMIAVVIDEYLGLMREAAEGGRMDDAVAVALEFRARRRWRLGDEAPGRTRCVGGVGGASRFAGIVRCSVP